MKPDVLLRLRFKAQGLHPRRPGGVSDVVRSAFGLQAQVPQASALSVRARGVGLVAGDVEHARIADRSVVWTWCMRGTLHLVAAEDVRWLLELVGPRTIAGRARRFAELGLDADTRDRGIKVLVSALADGPLTRAELGERLATAGVDPSGQRLPHLIGEAALLGLLCYGPGEAFVLLADWVPPAPQPVGDAGRVALVQRYRAAYGPSDAADLASWVGLPVREMRAAWALAGPPRGWEDSPPSGPPAVRLLPAFDTYLLGYRTRAEALQPEYARAVHPGGGWIHPTVTVDGRIVGTWRLGTDSTVDVDPFEPLAPSVEPGLAAEIADIRRFLDEAAT